MSALVPIAMFGWPLVVLALFVVLPPRRAVLASLLGAWLFLPMAKYEIAGLPDYTKMSATCLAVLLATLVFDPDRWFRLRLHWLDLPVLVWCGVPLASSLANGLGVYDGLSGVLTQLVTWGTPYLIGRLYFAERASIGKLAVALFVGGLIYVPFCLYEIRMAPTLHHDLFGFNQHVFLQHIRWGGYRPMVFMQHGLMVAMWMATASLCGAWLWYTGTLRKLWGVPLTIMVPVLLVTALLCKSIGALVLLAAGLATLIVVSWSRSRVAVLLLLLAPIAYMTTRADGWWDGRQLVSAATMISEQRASSLEGRLHNEDVLSRKALQRPWFGWAGWGRGRVYDEDGRDTSTTDGLWIIALSNYGLVGLVAVTGVLLMPVLAFVRRFPAWTWRRRGIGPAGVLAVVLLLHMVDSLFNAMLNPVYIVAAGGLAGLSASGALVTFRRSVRVWARPARPCVPPWPTKGEARQ